MGKSGRNASLNQCLKRHQGEGATSSLDKATAKKTKKVGKKAEVDLPIRIPHGMGKSTPGHVSKEENSFLFLMRFFETPIAQHIITAGRRSLIKNACI